MSSSSCLFSKEAESDDENEDENEKFLHNVAPPGGMKLPSLEGWRRGGVLRRLHAVAQRRGGSTLDPQPTPGPDGPLPSLEGILLRIPRASGASPYVKGDYLFNPSSRFITWLATIVRAADSGTDSCASGLDSPTDRSFCASSGWATKCWR